MIYIKEEKQMKQRSTVFVFIYSYIILAYNSHLGSYQSVRAQSIHDIKHCQVTGLLRICIVRENVLRTVRVLCTVRGVL